ncbi:MAG: peptide chain release factor 2 [Candidatus Omnitrophota bacterium]|nr:peptide chain release factor 2 [Candidatus Omnitrophota bacterium]
MLDDIKSKLSQIESRLMHLRVIFDIAKNKKLIDDLTLRMSIAGFWNDAGQSGKIVKQLKNLKAAVQPWEEAEKKYRELQEFCAILGPEDKELVFGLGRDTDNLLLGLERLEFKATFSAEFDRNNAILSINAGAGGTESCDWVSMLLRMYARWAEARAFKFATIDILPGEEAGIKNITALVEGEYAYGYLKAERGVHRLVRISPFDANKRRHTSFASVDVIPEVEDMPELKIEEKDLRVDVYRSKGAGGQSVNTTDSAVRITHLPTGAVAQCQNERSQHQNKQTAMKILKARIYELERQKQEAQLQKAYGAQKKKIEWGSQIRSYVLHPYTMVKDHRSGLETGDANKVLDGRIDDFMEAFLKQQANTDKGEDEKGRA